MIRNSTQWFQATGFYNSGMTTVRARRTRKVYYDQIEGDMAHCSVFDRDNNALILDETVIDGGTYKLIRFGDDIFLDPQGVVLQQ